MIEVEVPKWIEKYLFTPKKCHPKLKDKFLAEMFAIYDNLRIGNALVGDLHGYYAIDFICKGVCYRIIYQVLTEEHALIVYCGVRENAYKIVKRTKK